MKKSALFFRRIIGLLTQTIPTGHSHCLCCGITWAFTENHSTPYSPHRGMFPLCEWCWVRLTKWQRVPYYRQLFKQWERQHRSSEPMDVTENQVIEAVYAEKES